MEEATKLPIRSTCDLSGSTVFIELPASTGASRQYTTAYECLPDDLLKPAVAVEVPMRLQRLLKFQPQIAQVQTLGLPCERNQLPETYSFLCLVNLHQCTLLKRFSKTLLILAK